MMSSLPSPSTSATLTLWSPCPRYASLPGVPSSLSKVHTLVNFPSLAVPCLFVSGTRDAFGRPDELEAATAAIAGPVTHVWIEGGNHGLRGKDAEVASAVREWVVSLAPRPPG